MTQKLFDSVLVANRGEIAIRIIKTLRKLGIRSIAVYSDADAHAMHVSRADEAHYIGGANASESYLSIQNIITSIRKSGASAVHPGYGFLSENFRFAQALETERVVFVGPSSFAIKQMGDKIEAKKIALKAGVSTVPGYVGAIDNIEQAVEIANGIGFPVIVKAAAGGGGRGMRIANNPDEMVRAYSSAKMEATNSFNDSRLFIEKLIKKPRHIEIQVLADKYGNIVFLGDRECSIQRHHQKIIEEAPSSFVTDEMRHKMYTECKALAQSVGYYSAGTVEFIADQDGNFYFLEMNTRLQVEHPVTELITGIDIVEEMLKIAAGQKLGFTQEDVKLNGHAIECRICAEDPVRAFLPSSGRISEYQEPPKSQSIRIDTAVFAGSEVSMFYDPMIAKICSYDKTREAAIAQIKSALSNFVIRGIAHNIAFLEALVNHPRFISGDINTNFIDEEYPSGFAGAVLTSEIMENFLAAGIFIFISEQVRANTISDQLHASNKVGTRWVVNIDNRPLFVIIKAIENGYKIRQQSAKIYVTSNWTIGSRILRGYVNGRSVSIKMEHITTGYRLTYAGVSADVYVRSPRVSELESFILSNRTQTKAAQKDLCAPLNGKVSAVHVNSGDVIRAGQELLVLSAMKMENMIFAEQDGKIKQVHVQSGDHVNVNDLLIEFE